MKGWKFCMTVSMERLLQARFMKVKVRLTSPGCRRAIGQLGCASAAFILSAARIWDAPAPLAAMAVAALPLRNKCAAALGAAAGYGVFFRAGGSLPSVWCAGILLLTASPGIALSPLLPWLSGCLVALSALAFQTLGWEDGNLPVFAMQVGLACVCGALFPYCRTRRKTWTALACVEVFALGCIHRGLALFAAGAAISSLPVGTALLWAAGSELANPGAVPISLAVGLSALTRRLPLGFPLQRCVGPGLGALAASVLCRRFDPWLCLCFTVGGAAAGALPLSRFYGSRQGTAAAQVKLEQAARLMGQFQRSFLELPLSRIDEPAFVDKLRINACGCCSAREICTQESAISEKLLHGDLSFRCRKTGRVLRELQATQAQLGILRLCHSRQEEYRNALVQQYGYLSSLMELLSDSLAGKQSEPKPLFRIRISARSRKKEQENGDRCMAFAGDGCRFYILMCDGMGTGTGAAGEAEKAAQLLRGMLQVGFPPQYALGAINSQLALQDLAGAVTVDLAELHLDTGRGAVYKWGAPPSFLLCRSECRKIGGEALPPGLSLEDTRPTVCRLSLTRGETLILLSDGVAPPEALDGGADPAELAENLLSRQSDGSDDATAAVIRLYPCESAVQGF